MTRENSLPGAEGFGVMALLLEGRAPYLPQTGWNALPAVMTTAGILAVTPLAAFAVARAWDWLAGVGLPGASPAGAIERQLTIHSAIYLVVLNGMTIALTLLAAGQFGSRIVEALALRSPDWGCRTYLAAILVTGTGALIWFGIVLAWRPELVINDMRPYQELMAQKASWLMPPIFCLAAPLAEELLFRGFLFSALAKSRLGLAGATLVTTAAWTSLHVGRPAYAHVELFAFGLLLSWLLVRTGSLRVAIVCHMLFNTGVSLVVIFVRLPD